MPTQADYLAISDAVYTKFGVAPLAPVGWSLLETRVVAASGMLAASFKNNTSGEIIVGIQGTNSYSGNDAWSQTQKNTNALIAAGQTPQAYFDASQFVAQTKVANAGASVFVTGHSQGGGGAEYSAVQNNTGGASFGGPGIPNFTENGSHGNFTSYINYGDLIGTYAPLGGSHVGAKVFLGNPLDVMAEVAIGPYWGTYMALSNHSLNTYAVNVLGPNTPTPVPLNVQRMLDDPYGTFGADATSQFTVLSNGTLVTTYRASDGTLLGNATQTVDGTGSVSLFATSGQSWIKETGFFNTKGQLASAESQKASGDLERTTFDTANNQSYYARTFTEDLNGALKTQADVLDSLERYTKYYDTQNTHPYSELEISKDSTGKVTSAKPKIDGQPGNTVDFSVVGQVLGSALGRALAPNNQFGQIAIGTVAGAIGQKLAQAFSASLLTDAAGVNFGSAFANFDISLAGAGAGSVASFLTAELGHALGLTGFNSELFNASIGGLASGVANKIATEMLSNGLSFEDAIGTINFGAAATSAGYGISSLIGSYLGHELVPAQTREGAVGGQLLGAVGSAIGISAAISLGLGTVLNFIMPGLGSLLGTVVGTLIGDAIGSHPHPAAVDLIDQAGYLYGYNHSSVSASDGGDYGAPDKMANAAVAIVNAYLTAVKGAALDHSKQTMVGYVTDPDFRYVNGWVPSHTYLSFISPDDAVHAAALDVLQHTEVIGGDLLLKRAHHNFINRPHPNRNRRAKARWLIRGSGWRRAKGATASMACIQKRFA